MLIGGDFNFCLDPILDKSATATPKTKAAKTTLAFMKNLNLTEANTPPNQRLLLLLQPS